MVGYGFPLLLLPLSILSGSSLLSKLGKLLEANSGPSSPYGAVFCPGGGHGCLPGIPYSTEVKKLLKWAVNDKKYTISLCHGPACLLAATPDNADEEYIFKDYEI